jgi:hypothetical protein
MATSRHMLLISHFFLLEVFGRELRAFEDLLLWKQGEILFSLVPYKGDGRGARCLMATLR